MDNDERNHQYKAVSRILWVVLFANLSITILKIILGVVTGVLAVIADGFHSLVDTSSNLIGLTAIRLANRPADQHHPYGYQRYETLGALAIGGFLIVAAWEIFQSLIDRLINGAETELTWLTFLLIALTFPINLGIVYFEEKAGKRLNSAILLADATHTKTDLYISGSVIASLVGVWLGWSWLDLIVASGVVVLVVKAAIGILRDASASLADIVGIDPKRVEEIAYSVPGVRFVHNIRSRGTSDAVFVDLHVKVDPFMSTSMAHALASEVERRLKTKTGNIADAIVHIEPASGMDSNEWEMVSVGLRQIAEGMGLGLHDLHVNVDWEGKYSIELDLEIRGDVSLQVAHQLADEFETRAYRFWPQAVQVVTHLEPKPYEFQYPDEVSDPTLSKEVEKYLIKEVGSSGVTDVQALTVGGHLRLFVKLMMSPTIPLIESHSVVEKIKRKLLQQFPDVSRIVVHVEPSIDGSNQIS